jgi:hypothetical protein
MRRILSFGTELFWGIVWVFLVLAVGLFIIHTVRARVGGFVGTVAGDIEGAITPQGS